MVDAAAPASTPELQSRRALLVGAMGGIGALAATVVGGAPLIQAAAGSPLIMGSTTNSAGTSNTSLTTSSSGTALLVTQNGSGTALRGSAIGSNSIAGFFTAQNGTGISGVTGRSSSYGVFGQNNGAAGTGAAVRAAGGNNDGLVATSDNADRFGVKGQAPGTGVYGQATSSTGETSGVFGTTSSDSFISAGVFGLGAGNASGLMGNAEAGFGVYGESQNGAGVSGFSPNDFGVWGSSPTSRGVMGESVSGYGVYGSSASGFAGWFSSKVHVNGTLTKNAGAFKIDHPLDPAGQYLSHSFVESPDMKNVYDGVVTLDAKGEATVELPGYFEALNREMRYQLTAIGSAAPQLHVKAKVANGRFRIAGGTARQEVSWQVTGIRQDAFAESHRIVVEEPKPEAERGLYLHPTLHGQPESAGIGYRMRPRLTALSG